MKDQDTWVILAWLASLPSRTCPPSHHITPNPNSINTHTSWWTQPNNSNLIKNQIDKKTKEKRKLFCLKPWHHWWEETLLKPMWWGSSTKRRWRRARNNRRHWLTNQHHPQTRLLVVVVSLEPWRRRFTQIARSPMRPELRRPTGDHWDWWRMVLDWFHKWRVFYLSLYLSLHVLSSFCEEIISF